MSAIVLLGLGAQGAPASHPRARERGPDPSVSRWRGLSTAGTFLITTALAGIGLALRPADMRRAGLRPLALGACLWVLVAVSSLGLQELTGSL